MKEIQIPFMERFKPAMLLGRKTCTSRYEKYGEPGDVFYKWGTKFEILNVLSFPLHVVRDEYWYHEGCKSPQEFEQIWVELHPRRGFRPADQVHCHFFHLLSEEVKV